MLTSQTELTPALSTKNISFSPQPTYLISVLSVRANTPRHTAKESARVSGGKAIKSFFLSLITIIIAIARANKAISGAAKGYSSESVAPLTSANRLTVPSMSVDIPRESRTNRSPISAILPKTSASTDIGRKSAVKGERIKLHGKDESDTEPKHSHIIGKVNTFATSVISIALSAATPRRASFFENLLLFSIYGSFFSSNG